MGLCPMCTPCRIGAVEAAGLPDFGVCIATKRLSGAGGRDNLLSFLEGGEKPSSYIYLHEATSSNMDPPDLHYNGMGTGFATIPRQPPSFSESAMRKA